jgi:hypothetical protein
MTAGRAPTFAFGKLAFGKAVDAGRLTPEKARIRKLR